MQTFMWKINGGVKENTETLVNVVSFGDGYEQRQRKGLQTVKSKWSCEITGRKADIDEIVRFFTAHAGVSAFLWRGNTVKCAKWGKTHVGGTVYQISFELEQVMR